MSQRVATVPRYDGKLIGSASRRLSVAGAACLFGCTALLTRHTQVPGATALLVPTVLATVLLGMRLRIDSLALAPAFAWSGLSFVAAALLGVPLADAGRFAAILAGVLLATQFRMGRVPAAWPFAPLAVQAMVVVFLCVSLGLLQDPEVSLFVRTTVLESQWGDVYTQNGWQYRVQLVGNALLPLAYMVSLSQWRRGGLHGAWPFLFAASVAAAGNLTYAIVCLVFSLTVVWRSLQTRARALLVLGLIVACVAGGFTNVADDLVADKFDGADSSVGVRYDQVEVLLEAAARSPVNFIVGHGLGTRYPDGRQREYSQSQYIELQLLYVTYQIGAIGMVLIVATLWITLRRRMQSEGRLIFWSYMVCGLTNPYILDTSQMVVTMILLATYPQRSANE